MYPHYITPNTPQRDNYAPAFRLWDIRLASSLASLVVSKRPQLTPNKASIERVKQPRLPRPKAFIHALDGLVPLTVVML